MRQQLCLRSDYVFSRSSRVLTVKRFSQLFLSRLIFLRIGKQLRPNYRQNLFTSYKPTIQHNYVTTTKTEKKICSQLIIVIGVSIICLIYLNLKLHIWIRAVNKVLPSHFD